MGFNSGFKGLNKYALYTNIQYVPYVKYRVLQLEITNRDCSTGTYVYRIFIVIIVHIYYVNKILAYWITSSGIYG